MSDAQQPSKTPRLSREDMAKRDIGVTAIGPRLALTMTLAFCALIVAVPITEEILARRADERPPHGEVARLLPTGAELRAVLGSDDSWAALKAINHRLLKDLRAYEDGLKEESRLVQALVPILQVPISGWLGGGNEDAYLGRDGWVFYRRDLDHLIGPPFLDPRRLAARAAGGDELQAPPQSDPVRGILRFRDQLAARGIALLVVPVPAKASIHPERFSARYDAAAGPVLNPSLGEFLGRLRSAGVPAVDLAPVLWAERQRLGRPVYLASDTHWTPEGLEAAAQATARAILDLGLLPNRPATRPWRSQPQRFEGLGDSAQQLRLPAGWFPSQAVELLAVDDGERPWRAMPGADVLLLGDSFANIYSLAGMGWGEAAGLAERLAIALGGRDLDAILRNDAGSHATRRMLADELARGRDRLAGKKLVIWEFAARELSHGDWKDLPLELGEPRASTFLVPEPGAPVELHAVVASVTPAPRPGTVPYQDHVVAVHLVDLDRGAGPGPEQALAYMRSMTANVWTAAARYRPGDRVRLRLSSWAEAEPLHGRLNRSDPEDGALQLAEPCWAEEIRP